MLAVLPQLLPSSNSASSVISLISSPAITPDLPRRLAATSPSHRLPNAAQGALGDLIPPVDVLSLPAGVECSARISGLGGGSD